MPASVSRRSFAKQGALVAAALAGSALAPLSSASASESSSSQTSLRDEFCSYLDANSVNYILTDKGLISLGFYTDNCPDGIYVSINIEQQDCGYATFVCYSTCTYAEDQLADAYRMCNKLNATYRWIRFYVDDDNELTADFDAIVHAGTCGEECYEILNRMVDIIDGAYIAASTLDFTLELTDPAALAQ